MALAPWLDMLCAPFDLLGIPGFPNEGYDSDWADLIGISHECIDSAILHVASIMKVTSDFNVHEVVMMMIFPCTSWMRH
jgi:hypothetical protein